MICYRDRWFCVADTCKNFGEECDRSLTDEVKKAAAEWWGDEHAPISMRMGKPVCFEGDEQ